MKKKPAISVIIPAFNEEKYISKCLDSILEQETSVVYEVVVVNNNSTDKTRAIALDKGVKVINEVRQGTASAKNAGAKVAKASILVFLDADCIVPKNYIERIFKFFRKSPNIGVYGGPYVYYDGGVLLKFLTDYMDYFYWYFRIIKLFTGIQGYSGGNLAIKGEVFDEVRGYNGSISNIVIPDDLEFAVRLNNAGYKIYYDRNFKVFSSARRSKNFLSLGLWRRFIYSVRILVCKDNTRSCL